MSDKATSFEPVFPVAGTVRIDKCEARNDDRRDEVWSLMTEEQTDSLDGVQLIGPARLSIHRPNVFGLRFHLHIDLTSSPLNFPATIPSRPLHSRMMY